MTSLPLWRRVTGAVGMLLALVIICTVCFLSFGGAFQRTISVVVTADRAGLVLDRGAKVEVSGVEVGHVSEVDYVNGRAQLVLAIDAGQAGHIAGNSGAQIAATTVFGAKYVDLTVPANPVGRLQPGTVIEASNVTTEVNTVFQNLVDVTEAIEPDKLKASVSALAEGLRGQGAQLGVGLTQLNDIVARWNSEMPTFTSDVDRTARVAAIYASVGDDLTDLLRSGATVSQTLVGHQAAVDALLASTIGLGRVGGEVLGTNKNNTVALLHALTPTTATLRKYQQVLRCAPGEAVKDFNLVQRMGAGNTGYSLDLDVALLLGDNSYKNPENLPVVAGKGGPYGRPGCYPTITKENSPAPYLVINDGAILNGKGTYTPRLGDPIFTDYLFGNLGKQP